MLGPNAPWGPGKLVSSAGLRGWPRLLPRDPVGEAEVTPVAFDVVEADGLEELDVPVGGDGDEDTFESEGSAAGPFAILGSAVPGREDGRDAGWKPALPARCLQGDGRPRVRAVSVPQRLTRRRPAAPPAR